MTFIFFRLKEQTFVAADNTKYLSEEKIAEHKINRQIFHKLRELASFFTWDCSIFLLYSNPFGRNFVSYSFAPKNHVIVRTASHVSKLRNMFLISASRGRGASKIAQRVYDSHQAEAVAAVEKKFRLYEHQKVMKIYHAIMTNVSWLIEKIETKKKGLSQSIGNTRNAAIRKSLTMQHLADTWLRLFKNSSRYYSAEEVSEAKAKWRCNGWGQWRNWMITDNNDELFPPSLVRVICHTLHHPLSLTV